MSSLLAYGQGFLAGDIWSGAGLSEPWAQSFGWGDGEDYSVNQEENLESSEQGGLSQFFKEFQAGAPREAQDSPGVLVKSSTKQELHWDSPPQSPSTVFVHLPYSVLQILSTGTKADAVVVGFFQADSENSVDTLLFLPRALNFADNVVFQTDLLASINGKIICADKLNLPIEICTALGKRPQAFLAQHFSLEKYRGIIFGVWSDGSQVPSTAAGAFSDAVQALPMLLTNRINVKKYERIGRQFDAILKVMPDAVVFIEDECAQVNINPAAAALLGLPHHGEVDPSKVAIAMRKLTDRCSSRTDPQHCMRLLSSHDELEIEEDWELKMPRRVLHVRSYPVSSHARGRLWIYEDVTAERDAEQAIEAANKAKSQFLAMMSHELRTPMTGVLGMLDLLHLTDLGLEQQGLVKIMQESAEGLMEVINNILDYCKIEAGRLQLEEIDFPLRDMFEQVENMLRKSFLKKDLKVTISGESGGRNVVRGDPVRLRQVVLNLVSNAIKFTDHGSVSVSWRFLDPQWVDTTVVATSQSSPAKSKLINQIINASRGEKCSVEHLTSPSGRSVIIVHCSSEGVAGPYLESSTNSSTSARLPSQYSSQAPQSISSVNISASESATHRTGRPSFPVSYSDQPLQRPAAECPTVETRHSFNERKSIVGKDVVRDSSTSDVEALTHGRHLQDNQIIYSQKAPVQDPVSGSEEGGFRTRKYQRLSVEDNNGLLRSPVNENGFPCQPIDKLGILDCPKWLLVSDAESRRARSSSTDSTLSRTPWKSTGSQRMGPSPSDATTSSNASDGRVVGATSVHPSVAQKSRDSSGLQFCKVGEGVRYTENRLVEDRKQVKPEDKVWLEVTIADAGVGIGREQLDRLFVGSHAGSQRRNATGTGLGLAICKGLLCLIEGKVQFDSKIGEGTTVVLTVPLLPAEEGVQVLIESASLLAQPTKHPEPIPSENSTAESKTGEAECKQIKVLVAEDNKVNQLLIRKMFRHFGHEVEVVGNGKLAVEAVQRKSFDLILMDVQMPILDGLSATKAIRALPPPASNIPIYALSADNPGSGPMEETGLDGYMRKPIAWEMMSQLVDQILAAKNEL